jgi:glutathione S-transferase
MAVRLGFAEMNCRFTSVLVELSSMQHLTREYMSVNPAMLVPALKTGDGKVITESVEILRFVLNQYGHGWMVTPESQQWLDVAASLNMRALSFGPRTAGELDTCQHVATLKQTRKGARLADLQNECVTDEEKEQVSAFLSNVQSAFLQSESELEICQAAQSVLHQALQRLNDHLATQYTERKSQTGLLLGDRMCIADCVWAAILHRISARNLLCLPGNASAEALLTYHDNLQARPSYQRAITSFL